MPVQVQCPNQQCRKVFTVADDLVGRTARCRGCGLKFPLMPSHSESKPATPGSRPAGSAPAQTPTTIGRYQIQKQLGAGGFGVVFLAHDPQLHRDVALKVLHPEMLDSREVVERFLREARLAARLLHPNIVPVFDAGEEQGRSYIASAYIAGSSLLGAIPEHGMDQLRAVRLTIQLCEALEYAHQRGILHRDVKPANILLDGSDHPYLMDFGLAGWTGQDITRLTKAGAVMGTPAYMAPEQALGDQTRIGRCSDLYSAGVVLYEMLAGQTPFGGPPSLVIFNVIHQAPTPPSQLRPGLDRKLEAICLRAMAKKTEERYDSCAVFAEILRGWLAVHASTPSRPASGDQSALFAQETVLVSGTKVAELLTAAAESAQEPRQAKPPPLPAPRPAAPKRPASTPSPPPPARKRKHWWWLALVVFLLAAAGGGGWAYLQRPPDLSADIEECHRIALLGKGSKSYVESRAGERFDLWRTAAKKGSPAGQFLFSRCHELGIGTEKDIQEAIHWLQKSAEQRFSWAQNNMGNLYLRGEGVPKDLAKAFHWFRLAADQGLALAQYNLGDCYARGDGVVRDSEEAYRWYRKSAEQGLPFAETEVGIHYLQGKEKKATEAVTWFRKAAEKGHAAAQFWLGLAYAKGEGVDKSQATAVVWYLKSAEQGNRDAQNNLGALYYNGEDIPRDDDKAYTWFKKAAEQGHLLGQSNLGRCYLYGRGTAANPKLALDWFRKSANQGEADGQFMMGWCYEKNLAVNGRDLTLAAQWYEKASAQGHEAAGKALERVRAASAQK